MQLATLMAEYDALADGYDDAIDLPADIEQQLLTLDGHIAALSDRPLVYGAEDMAMAGAFVSLTCDGSLRIDKGYVRPEENGDAHRAACNIDAASSVGCGFGQPSASASSHPND